MTLNLDSGSPTTARLVLLGISGATLLCVLAIHERELAGFDPASFVLALKYGFSVKDFRPHPPGYPGFYLLWSGIQYVTGWSAHTVLLLANVIFAIIAINLSYVAARRISNEKVALWTAILVATNPMLLYYESVSEIYAYDAALSAFLVLILLGQLPRRWEMVCYFVYGLLGAFRLSSIVLTLPVVLAVIAWDTRRHRKTASQSCAEIGAILLGITCWLIPYVLVLGGWQEFVTMFREASDLPAGFVQNLVTILPYLLWMTVGLIPIWIASRRNWTFLRSDRITSILLMLIALPAMFFMFRYYAKGYALLFLTPVCLLTVRGFDGKRMLWLAGTLNLSLFFITPFVAPTAQSALDHTHRSLKERMSTSLIRTISFYEMSYPHILASDAAMRNVDAVLSDLQDSSCVLVDYSAAQFAYPRSLQVSFPGLRFLMPADSERSRAFYSSHLRIEPSYANTQNVPMYCLTRTALTASIRPPGELAASNKDFSLFRIKDTGAFRAYINCYFLHSSN